MMPSESTRGILYRLVLLAALIYIGYTRPDDWEQILPVALALVSSGLATVNTKVR